MIEKINKYTELRKKIQAFSFAMYLISWDSETEAPIGCFEERSKQIGVLSQMSYDIMMNPETIQLITDLYNNKEKLDETLQIEIKNIYKTIQKKILVPSKELIEYDILLSKASPIWATAKEQNNYELFKPILQQIIEYNKKYVEYVKTDTLQGYNVLLDEYEEESNMVFYDEFFAELRKEIVPLVKKINEAGYHHNEDILNHKYEVSKQRKFAEYIMDVMCFDKTKGLLKESMHPFTSGFGNQDVRITTHYYENLLSSSIFSVIHEGGHATYELQCDDSLNDTLVGGGSTMAMHESQSRFYENIVGRSYGFWEKHYPVLQELFKDELQNTSLDDFYHHVNKVECSLIRTEADELTYPLHIMIRYEIEKAIFNNELTIDELPAKWNSLYKEYLGIDVPSDSQGILQDIHWSGGSFGYFPTYALGSAYAAQLLEAMKKDIDFDNVVKEDNLQQINQWLKAKVHKYGATRKPNELLLTATGEKFNPKYYVNYLKNKYRKIYNIEM